jgi:hypothetical protein
VADSSKSKTGLKPFSAHLSLHLSGRGYFILRGVKDVNLHNNQILLYSYNITLQLGIDIKNII